MKIALVADWLVTYGGAEHVLRELCMLYPHAPLFTTIVERTRLGALRDMDIRTTRLQIAYHFLQRHQPLLPWMPRVIEDVDLRGYDVVLSSSHAVAKGVIPENGSLHVCYCHTPMRYAWEMEETYLDDFRVPRLIRPWIRWKLRQLRRWDLTSAQRVDLFIANSKTTQERIARIYARESIVIPPPVDDRFFAHAGYGIRNTEYFLAVGRLVPYKRFDLLIEAANILGIRLQIAGTGQDESRLKRLAGPTVKFLGYVPDDDLPTLYAEASAVFFPQEEDAGIVLLEALATGTPVIVYRAGGAVDAVEENRTGIFFDQQTLPSLTDAIDRFRKTHWDRGAIRASAARFRRNTFQETMKKTIEEAWRSFQTSKES